MASPFDQQCLISLGANLGDRVQTLQAAFTRLREHAALSELRVSSFYETAPIGGPSGQQGFINAAATFRTSLAPLILLRVLQQIESDLGRIRGKRWAERTLDLDLLLYGEEVIDTPDLAVPHPRMVYRRFVLEPAVEIAAGMKHVLTGYKVQELLARIDACPIYIAIVGPSNKKAFEISRLVKKRLNEPSLWLTDPLSADERRGLQSISCVRWRRERRNDVEAAIGYTQVENIQIIISDFWIGQLEIDRWAPNEEGIYVSFFDDAFYEFSDVTDSTISSLAVRPTLLVWLRPETHSKELPSGWHNRPPVPFIPTIVVAEDNPLWAVAEITAAIAAINDQPRKLPASDSEPPPADKS